MNPILAAPVVAPMILQFFVLTLLWVGTLPWTKPRGPGADLWGAVLLPFLMISTGLLFFSAPLAPLWQPLLGAGGAGLGGFPAALSLGLVLALNVGVVGWCIRASGGLRASPYVPILLAIPVLVGLMGGGPGGIATAALAAGAILMALRVEGERAARAGAESRPAGRGLRAGIGLGTLLLMGIARWLSP
jgi:hypothetical protein